MNYVSLNRNMQIRCKYDIEITQMSKFFAEICIKFPTWCNHPLQLWNCYTIFRTKRIFCKTCSYLSSHSSPNLTIDHIHMYVMKNMLFVLIIDVIMYLICIRLSSVYKTCSYSILLKHFQLHVFLLPCLFYNQFLWFS